MGFNETRQDITASIKEQSDIVKIIGEHVDLKKSGVRYLGLCPFHGEKTPSFSVHGVEQFFYCFGCGESGDVFSFLMKYQNCDFPSALKQLADRLNIQLPEKKISRREKERGEIRKRMYGVTEQAANVYMKYLREGKTGEVARTYLAQRGISEQAQRRFAIGYAPAKEDAGWNFLGSILAKDEEEIALQVGLVVKNERGGCYDRFRDRVLFPIYDVQGRICGFGGRIIGEGQPKYMNSPESHIFNKSKNLLGLYQQREEIRKSRKAVLVEGNFDMLALVEHGCDNVVAPLGTALTAAQVRLIGRYADEVTLLFDGDEAGVKAALRAAPHFLSEKVHARVALLPTGHDPDTFIRQKGREALNLLLSKAEDLSEFVLTQLIAEHGLSLEGKSRIAEELKPLVAAASSSLQRSVTIAHFAERLGLAPQQLESAVAQHDEFGKRDGEVRQQRKMGDKSDRKLSAAQKRLVQFMIMYPRYFKELADKNLRGVLQGGMGEILFLQVQMMLAGGDEIQPEDILAALPEGEERKLVADILLNGTMFDQEDRGEEQLQEELRELLEWLDIQEKRNISIKLTMDIEEAQRRNDFAALEKLLHEKQEIEQEMRRYQTSRK